MILNVTHAGESRNVCELDADVADEDIRRISEEALELPGGTFVNFVIDRFPETGHIFLRPKVPFGSEPAPCHCGEPSIAECPCCTHRVCAEHLVLASKALGEAVGLGRRRPTEAELAEAMRAESQADFELSRRMFAEAAGLSRAVDAASDADLDSACDAKDRA